MATKPDRAFTLSLSISSTLVLGVVVGMWLISQTPAAPSLRGCSIAPLRVGPITIGAFACAPK